MVKQVTNISTYDIKVVKAFISTNPGRFWSAFQVAFNAKTTIDAAKQVLENFTDSGLVEKNSVNHFKWINACPITYCNEK